MALPSLIAQNIITAGGSPLNPAQYQAVVRVITDLYDFSPAFRSLANVLSVPGNIIVLSNDNDAVGLSNPGAFQPGQNAAGGLLAVLNVNFPFWTASDRGSVSLVDAAGATFAASFHRFMAHELVHALTYLAGQIKGDVLPWVEEGTASATPQAIASRMGSSTQTDMLGETVPLENAIMQQLQAADRPLDSTFGTPADVALVRAAYYFKPLEYNAGTNFNPGGFTFARMFADEGASGTPATSIDFRSAGESSDLPPRPMPKSNTPPLNSANVVLVLRTSSRRATLQQSALKIEN